MRRHSAALVLPHFEDVRGLNEKECDARGDAAVHEGLGLVPHPSEPHELIIPELHRPPPPPRHETRERYFSLFRSMGQVFWGQDFLGNIADFDFAGRRGRERRKSIEIAIERAREREGSMTPGPMSTEDPAAPQAEEAQGFASRPRRSCRDRKPALFTYQTAGQTHDVSWVVTSTVYLPCSYAFSLCIV